MEATSGGLAETLAAALLFAAVFVWGGRVRVLGAIGIGHRSVISFGAGMAAAYVFVRVMPELHGAREAFVKSTSIVLRYEGMGIYFVSLLGFLLFYGVDHLRPRRHEDSELDDESRAFRLHIGGFAVYVAVIGYLLVRNLEESDTSIVLYALAIAVHFLTVDHSLREEYGAPYERGGRYVLAAMAVVGWGLGELLPLPVSVVALLLALVSGAIMLNSLIGELPSETDGRFGPFVAGGVLYGLVLVPLG